MTQALARYARIAALAAEAVGAPYERTRRDGRNGNAFPAEKWTGPLGEVTLVNNSTDTKWCQDLAGESSAMCSPLGRLAWLDETKTPVQGQAVFYKGADSRGFCTLFADVGSVWVPA